MRCVFVMLWVFTTSSVASEMSPDYRIAYGSCALDREPQPIWFDIIVKEPDLFLFIGDNQYADYRFDKTGNRIHGPVTDPELIRQAYTRLGSHEGFQILRSLTPILATWDDHDYGANDAGKEFALKQESQQAFMDFFEYHAQHPMRTREGIYHAKLIQNNGHTVQVIMLDTRYHRDPLERNPSGRPDNKGPYIPTTDTSRTLLGATQWQWLEQQLMVPADVRFIVSSIQVVAHEHGWETWGNFPHERTRLYRLIERTAANGVIFLSGDRHLMEVSKDTGEYGVSVPYVLWDFTSSGMTQAFRQVNEENQYRVGQPVRDTHYATIDIYWAEPTEQSKIIFTALGLQNNVLQRNELRLGDLTMVKSK